MKHWRSILASGLLSILVACATPGGTNPPPPPPPPGAPAAPSNFAATATSSSSIRLTWTAPAGATAYILERKTGAGSYVAITPPTASPHNDTALSASTKYDYRLKASNASGDSPAVEGSATTQAASGGIASRVGSVSISESLGVRSASASFFGIAKVFPQPPSGGIPGGGTCSVSVGTPKLPVPPDPTGGLSFISQNAGAQITLKNGATTFATLQKDTSGIDIIYAANTLPALPAALTVDIPGATNGFPAFSSLALPTPPADFSFSTNPAGSINKDTSFSWTNPAGSDSQMVFMGIQPASGSTKFFFCIAPDTGSFSFPAQTKTQLDAAGINAAQLFLASRSISRTETQGSTHVILSISRSKSLVTP